MKYLKIFAIAVILPYLVATFGCQNSDKQTTGEQNKQTFDTRNEKEPLSMGLTAPKTDEKIKLSDVEDGSFKRINYNQPTDNFNTQDKRMIIRSGTMNLETESFNEAEGKIKQIVNSTGGYITNSSSQVNASGKKQGSITIRVSADKFDDLLSQLAGIGKVINQNISGKDVTEEYMDAEARLKTQQELESRLLKLLAEKTANLTSIVEVEQKLASVRENIEKTEGRMRYLKDQAAFSTLTVAVYEPSMLVTSSGGGFFYELGESIEKGLTGFTKVLSGIITFIIAFSPIIAVLLIILYFVRKHFRKRKLAQAA